MKRKWTNGLAWGLLREMLSLWEDGRGGHCAPGWVWKGSGRVKVERNLLSHSVLRVRVRGEAEGHTRPYLAAYPVPCAPYPQHYTCSTLVASTAWHDC